MKKGKINTLGFSIVILLLSALLCAMANGYQMADTTLEITDIRGGLGQITVDVANTGDITAEEVAIFTTVTGGLFNNIDIYHQCSGCEICGTTLEPNAIKTESTLEAGVIFGIGPVEISVVASALNADEITTQVNGIVFGPWVIISP
jgi:hypothetical protein